MLPRYFERLPASFLIYFLFRVICPRYHFGDSGSMSAWTDCYSRYSQQLLLWSRYSVRFSDNTGTSGAAYNDLTWFEMNRGNQENIKENEILLISSGGLHARMDSKGIRHGDKNKPTERK